LRRRRELLRIYRRISTKKYLHGKATYEYERFYVPVPKRYHHIVKPFVGKEISIEVEPVENGFVVRGRVVAPPRKTPSIYEIMQGRLEPS